MTVRKRIQAAALAVVVLIGGATAYLAAEGVQAVYGAPAADPPPMARSTPRFDPFAAVRDAQFFRSQPPVAGPWQIAAPSTQPDLSAARRRWTFVWVPAGPTYDLCWTTVAKDQPHGSGCFYPSARRDAGNEVIAEFWIFDTGYLQLLGSAPAGVVSVEALAIEGTRTTAHVVEVGAEGSKPLRLFALTLFRLGGRLGEVQLIGRDAAGRVVVTRTFDDQGR